MDQSDGVDRMGSGGLGVVWSWLASNQRLQTSHSNSHKVSSPVTSWQSYQVESKDSSTKTERWHLRSPKSLGEGRLQKPTLLGPRKAFTELLEDPEFAKEVTEPFQKRQRSFVSCFFVYFFGLFTWVCFVLVISVMFCFNFFLVSIWLSVKLRFPVRGCFCFRSGHRQTRQDVFFCLCRGFVRLSLLLLVDLGQYSVPIQKSLHSAHRSASWNSFEDMTWTPMACWDPKDLLLRTSGGFSFCSFAIKKLFGFFSSSLLCCPLVVRCG